MAAGVGGVIGRGDTRLDERRFPVHVGNAPDDVSFLRSQTTA
jgi:hypothetical protein